MNEMNKLAAALPPPSLPFHAIITWPEEPSKRQVFSLPSSIIYYILKNPTTPKVYSKLTFSCKYFFEKHPIILAPRIHANGKKLCSNHYRHCKAKKQECCVKVNLEKLSTKIWCSYGLELDGPDAASKIIPPLFSKLYCCDDAVLVLNQCNLTLDEFKFFADAFRRIVLHAKITTHTIATDGDENENVLMLDKLLDAVPKVTEFAYSFDLETPAVDYLFLKDILKHKQINNFNYLCLIRLPEIFSVKILSDFIKTHKDKKCWFDFRRDISFQYKFQLDVFMETLLASDASNCFLRYPGQDKKKFKIIQDRFLSKLCGD